MAFCPPLIHFLRSTTILSLLLTISIRPQAIEADKFITKEATVDEIHAAFRENKLNSKQLVKLLIQKLNPVLLEVNPEALDQADQADRERKREKRPGELLGLHGIPILLKDNIATKDKLNTTAGSYALLGSAVPRDAGVVERLRKAGAIIIGKASLSEWSKFRSGRAPNGWCARSGQGRNPYNLSADPCGSSSGSAISMAANMAAVSLGTETDGSILCPSSYNSVVGIKPTVGLTSRSGVIPISPRQDSIGPICRTVADAVRVLDATVGFDELDAEATKKAQEYIPAGGYTRFLRLDGLKGKRLGIVRNPFFNFDNGSLRDLAFKRHFRTLRQMGALLVDKLEIANVDKILSSSSESSEIIALEAEFKLSLNYYLKELLVSPVRTLADVIAFDNKFAGEEMIEEYGQALFTASEATNGIDYKVKQALSQLQELSSKGLEKTMMENELDAIVTPGSGFSTILAIGGFPGINVPAGYDDDGVPFGICFGGLTGSEPKLIEIAYAFEQATKIRKPPEVHFPKKSFI
ncbi:hypothetical protein Nepgr_030777 [Nepenthes gracilis]|uniref:Amidase domain-containing protein n=1 Tax=Nepenthes gracilis TaxID=150966 RepID=A0AAD3Y6D9_NEPGR|nr:hypothetical protein Nepgr_030777 [Nepenthes gracilis]